MDSMNEMQFTEGTFDALYGHKIIKIERDSIKTDVVQVLQD